VHDTELIRSLARDGAPEPPEVDATIETPRGNFLKRGSTGHLDFISPLPRPFNHGSVPSHLGHEGDLLEAVVLGPRLPLGARIRVEERIQGMREYSGAVQSCGRWWSWHGSPHVRPLYSRYPHGGHARETPPATREREHKVMEECAASGWNREIPLA
jgi:hypothetical protein